ncbi:CAMK/CAMKL/PASK protein kinase [Rhodotorula toruloides ATCC 204091]|uniref:CAMK/CAMKL/PASK protein kinase n=1 Tax=Rhodotorula toruloides TaxID=5286 RepID=A0A0K3CF44_RHOTO|nr:CAMK/CAMKL/PASK protein kinase [Rhodotorula toruloides ATCC 204091]KAK4336089.1 CAMK/CAMKL/PASK protein kinase [Rhodotorula toruloides]PRQ75858.1 CAMK/CAMKL/PASK protein kinase [Rhodotorula toruloides]
MDACVVAQPVRQPLTFTTPSSSFAQSRMDKGARPVSMSIASSSSATTSTSSKPYGVQTRGARADHYLAASPLTPSSPHPPASSSIHLATSSHRDDEHMSDAFVTPPQASRTALRPLSIDMSPSAAASARLPSKKGKSPVMPLTPPLTPPYLDQAALLPSLSSPTPAHPPRPTTVSGRALANHPLHPLFASTYTLADELGAGGFGFVVRASRNHDSRSVAVKFIERAKIPSHGWVKSRSWGDTPGLTQPTGPKLVPMEAFVLRSIRHEGVVAFIDLFEDDEYFYLVMEHHGSPWQIPEKHAGEQQLVGPPSPSSAAMSPTLTSSWPRLAPGQQTVTPTSSPTMCSSPLPDSPASSPTYLAPPRPPPMMRRSSHDLFECIEQHSRFDERTAKYVFAQIVEIVYALQQMGICHRDIKDENIVITHDYRVKLIDFGSAVIFDPRQPSPVYHRFFGTTSFAAAEILRGEAYQAPPAEVWSLGVLLSILVTGECPFSDAEAAKSGRLSKPKIRVQPEIEHLLRACLEVDVSKRISVAQIRRHPWLADIYSRRA